MAESRTDPARRAYAESFRELATAYAGAADEAAKGDGPKTRPERARAMYRDRDAGALLVESYRRGWLNGIDGLAALIAWLDGGEHPDGASPTLVRCPANVFGEVVGNGRITIRAGTDEASDTHGGLLPRLYPARFPGRSYLRECARAADEAEAAAWDAAHRADRFEQKARACRLLADLIEHGEATPSDSHSADGATMEPERGDAAPPLDELVDLDQCAALVSVSKRTLERALHDGKLPEPDYRGGGGKAHKWHWSTIRPDLEQHYRPDLPARFPGSRLV